MVRSTAIAALLFLLLPLGVPLVLTKADSSLPACCRQEGKHRCGVAVRFRQSTQESAGRTAVRSAKETCPYSSMLFGPTVPDGIVVPVNLSWARSSTFPAGIHQAVLQARISQARSHHKRGPPPVLA